MSTIVTTKSGKQIRLLDPSEKAKRYSKQLKHGSIRETGELLSDEQKAWRKGYLSARSDSAMAYCSNKGIDSKTKLDRQAYWKKRKEQKKSK